MYLNEKKKQDASVVVLVDASTSMLIGDEVRGQTRWDVATQGVKQARDFAKTLGAGPRPQVLSFRLQADRAQGGRAGGGAETVGPRDRARLGNDRKPRSGQEGTSRRLARLVILSDFANNNGSDPLEAARRLKGQGVPVVTVGLGTENAGAVHRDIKLRDIIAGPTVFVKNQADVKASMRATGFANQTLEVELCVEGQARAGRKNPGQGTRRGRRDSDHRPDTIPRRRPARNRSRSRWPSKKASWSSPTTRSVRS